MKYTLRKFFTLLANGASMEIMQKNDVLEKAYLFEGEVSKEAAEAVRALRVENGVSEKQVMTALGLTDVQEYMSWENGDATIELTADNMTALAKVLKTDLPTLAAKMVSADGPDPVIDDTTGAGANADAGAMGGNAGGDQSATPGTAAGTPPAKSADGVTAEQIRKQKQAGGSSAARVAHIGGGGSVIGKSDEVEKSRRVRELRKSIVGLSDKAIAKGTIVSTDFAPSNTLNPELGSTMLDLLVDQSEFLKSIQVRQMSRQKGEVLVMDVQSRKSLRSAPGWPSASDLQKTINKSKVLNAEKITQMFLVENSTLMNYQNNVAGLENEIINGITGAFRNDIVDLGFNGLTSNYDSIVAAGGTGTFTDLNQGWLTIANTSAPAGQVLNAATDGTLYDTGATTGNFVPQKAFDKLIKQGFVTTPRFFTDTTPFVIGAADWQQHESNLLTRNDATPILINGVDRKYRGRPVSQSNYIATKNLIHTQLQNYILGVVTGTQGSDGIVIERHIVPQGVLYVIIMYVDFDYVNYDAVAVCHS